MKVRKLDQESVERIHSEQIIKGVAHAIKELLENSIDAGATDIKISLLNYGIEEILIIDNGMGLSVEDLQKLCKRGATSKIQ